MTAHFVAEYGMHVLNVPPGLVATSVGNEIEHDLWRLNADEIQMEIVRN